MSDNIVNQSKQRNPEGYIGMLEVEIIYWKEETRTAKRRLEEIRLNEIKLRRSLSSVMLVIKDMLTEPLIAEGPYGGLLSGLVENELKIWRGEV